MQQQQIIYFNFTVILCAFVWISIHLWQSWQTLTKTNVLYRTGRHRRRLCALCILLCCTCVSNVHQDCICGCETWGVARAHIAIKSDRFNSIFGWSFSVFWYCRRRRLMQFRSLLFGLALVCPTLRSKISPFRKIFPFFFVYFFRRSNAELNSHSHKQQKQQRQKETKTTSTVYPHNILCIDIPFQC